MTYSLAGVHVRELEPGDIDRGLLESLDALRPAGGMDRDVALKVLEEIQDNPRHIVAVAVEGGRVVGAATLLVERKFIHEGGLAGHIEDVVVATDFQGMGIGRRLVGYLLEVAGRRGCYRTTLDCEADLVPFYAGMGFRRKGESMRYDHT